MSRPAVLLALAGLALAAVGSAASKASAPILLVNDRGIYAVQPSGGARSLTGGSRAQKTDAAWSPDRSRITYQVEGGDGAGVWVMTADGRARHRVVEGHIHLVTWLDRRTVMFVLYHRLDAGEITVVRADGSGLRTLTRGRGSDSFPTASPDGRRIAFARDRNGAPGVFVMREDGNNVRRLTHSRTPAGVSWSPNGRWIAFETQHRATNESTIELISPNGLVRRTLVSGIAPNASATWSPDSRSIAFQALSENDEYEIYVVDVASTRVTNLTADPSHAQTLPAWSPDGRRIAFFESEASGTTKGRVVVVGRNGTRKHPVTSSRAAFELSWAPTR